MQQQLSSIVLVVVAVLLFRQWELPEQWSQQRAQPNMHRSGTAGVAQAAQHMQLLGNAEVRRNLSAFLEPSQAACQVCRRVVSSDDAIKKGSMKVIKKGSVDGYPVALVEYSRRKGLRLDTPHTQAIQSFPLCSADQ